MLCLLSFSMSAVALESDRQQPLEINANATDGTLGDGITTMRGDVEIRQGTLHITADEAEVKKADGRVLQPSLSVPAKSAVRSSRLPEMPLSLQS